MLLRFLALTSFIIAGICHNVYCQEYQYQLGLTGINYRNNSYRSLRVQTIDDLILDHSIYTEATEAEQVSFQLILNKVLNEKTFVEYTILRFNSSQFDEKLGIIEHFFRTSDGTSYNIFRGANNKNFLVQSGVGLGRSVSLLGPINGFGVLSLNGFYKWNSVKPHTLGGFNETNIQYGLEIAPRIGVTFQVFNRIQIGYSTNFIFGRLALNTDLKEGINVNTLEGKRSSVKISSESAQNYFGFHNLNIMYSWGEVKRRRRRTKR